MSRTKKRAADRLASRKNKQLATSVAVSGSDVALPNSDKLGSEATITRDRLPNKRHWVEYGGFIVALLAAVAASLAAGFTGYQAWIAKDTAKRQLRAYLSVAPSAEGLQHFGIGKKARAHGVFQNGGDTPAYAVTWIAGIQVAENKDTVKYGYIGCKEIMSRSDSAKWFVAKQPVYPVYDRPTAFSKKEVEDIESGIAAIYFNGRVCYLDVFEEVQAIDFCIFWDWDRERNQLYSAGKFCRHGNGPPEAEATISSRELS